MGELLFGRGGAPELPNIRSPSAFEPSGLFGTSPTLRAVEEKIQLVASSYQALCA